MTGEGPRRRASDQTATAPTSARPAPHPEPKVVPSRESSLFLVGNGRANGTRERRQRDLDWNGPERRISGRF